MRILITGGSSGIGLQAAIQLCGLGHELIIPCRDKNTSKKTLDLLTKLSDKSSDNYGKHIAPFADLSDLRSIETMYKSFENNEFYIDVLILNAGLQYTGAREPRLSKQKSELTFAVNHLSHQYIVQKFLPYLLRSKQPRIIITSSEVHNPETPGGQVGERASLGDLSGIGHKIMPLMIDGNNIFNADKAYKDSKLCNILFARELAKRLISSGNSIPIIAWAPGLVIPKSKEGFFRYSRKYNELGQILFEFIARDLIKLSERVEKAGSILSDLACNDLYNEKGFNYYSNSWKPFRGLKFEISEVSKEARNDLLARDLWIKTANIAGIKPDIVLFK
tara:strand:+ start:2265 stop:3266 length:1002 start_codon:yes stop_codon:yes gene_type:complete